MWKTCLFIALILNPQYLLDSNAAIIDKSGFGNISCIPYAYADFNADKLVDIYCVSQPGLSASTH